MTTSDQVIAYGLAEVGEPYVWGAEGPDAFDCSGLMQWIFGKVGIELPRVAREQQKFATRVTDPRPGDLVFWGSPATHVGLYVGDGRFLAAPKAGERVRVSPLYGSPTFGRVPGLAGGFANIASPITQPVAGFASDVADRIGQVAVSGLVALGGIALVAVGAWQTTRGSSSHG